jgi:hypothetical protein
VNLLPVYIDMLKEEQEQYPVPKVYWIRMSQHCEITNTIGLKFGGAVYGHVLSETRPSENDLPSDFEECVYIGKSGKGYYPDRKNGPNKNPKECSFLYKRQIDHRKGYVGTDKLTEHQLKKYGLFWEKYGKGIDVINGTHTGKPLWLGLIPIPIDMPNSLKENWLLRYERLELMRYRKTFGSAPLMNLDEDCSNKDVNSFSSNYKSTDITQFCAS